ncbi:MAG: hypothetical protein ACJ79K_09735 [Gemmatimonadaceae bacterium]
MILLTGGWLVYGAVSPIPTLLGLVAFGLFILKVFVNYPGRWFLGFGGILAAALLLLGLPEVGRRPTLLWSQEGVTARGVIRTRLVQWHSLVLRGTVLVTAIVLLVGFAHELIWWLFYVPSGPVQAAVKKAGGIGAVLLAIASTAYTGFIAAPSPRGNDEGRATDKTHWLVLIAPPLALLVIAELTAWGTHSMLRVTGAAAAASLIRSANAPTFTVGVAWALIAGAYLECAFAALEYWTERASMGRLWRSVGPLVALAIATTAFLLLTPVRVHSALVARGVAVDLVRADMIGQAVAGLAFVIVLLVWSLSFARRANDRTRVLLVFATFAFATVIGFSMKDPALTDRSSRLLFLVLATAQTAIAAAIGLGWMTDPNLVALHTFYKSRLVRGYLGASNTARHGRTEITDTVAGDDLLMCTLRNTEHGAPYHLINTTLNLVGGRDLATSQRSAATFVITRDTCGSARTGSRPTHLYMSGAMTLGTAVATSGAAFSPNMGTKTPSAAVAMLLALLNVRTGIWAPTPDKRRWRESQPRLWPYYLLRESLSQTNTLSSFCYLSDGGHFDNTGVYSLIERGVRFIVLADCGADPKPCFSDMGDLIRHCRIDFGTEISIDVEPMREASDELHSRHMVVGTILYSPEHGARLGWPASDDRKGILLWLKPAVVATDPADVRQYHLENKDFPQQTTLDQWFDEAQFESYRRLGLETARAAFKAVPEGTIDVATAAAAIAQ